MKLWPKINLKVLGSFFNTLSVFVFLFSVEVMGQVSPSELSKDFVRIERTSEQGTGFYYGLKEQDQRSPVDSS